MKETVKAVLALTAALAAFGAGYLIGVPLCSQIALWMTGESASNVELYQQIRYGLPGMMGGMVCGTILGAAAGFAVERLINRHGVPGLIDSPVREFQEGSIEVRILAIMNTEEGQEQQQPLFEGKARALALASLFSPEPEGAVLLRSTGGTALRLERRLLTPYDEQEAAEGMILTATVLQAGKPVHAFEALKGTFRTPEAQYVSFCRFPLRYVGCEETVEAELVFKGSWRNMRRIFFQS